MQQKESILKYFSYDMIPEEFSCNCGDLENSNLRTFMPWLALLSFPASLLLVIYLQTRACACIFYLPKCLCFHLFCSSEICLSRLSLVRWINPCTISPYHYYGGGNRMYGHRK